MRCKKVFNLLNMYADREISQDMHSHIEKHLAGCKKCTGTLNEILRLKNIIGTVPQYTANPFLWTRIAEGIKQLVPAPVSLPVLNFLRVWVSAAGILIVLSGFVLFNLPEIERPRNDTDRQSITRQMLEVPITPENMEKITLNLLVYTNGKLPEVPYVKY